MGFRFAFFSLWSVLLTGLLLPSPGQSQVIARPTVAKKTEATPSHRVFVVDRDAVKMFKYAIKRLEKKDYIQGLEALQRILELKEDSNYYQDGDTDKTLCRSLKGQALKLIEQLPKEGREQYLSKYGDEAKRQFEEAREKGDIQKMELLARSYFHTPAGYKATWWLGNRHFDRLEPLAAALFYERLRKTKLGAKQFEPMLTLKTAICWGRAGMPKLAIEKLTDLKKSVPKGGRLTIGGRPVAIFDKEENALGWMVNILGGQQGFHQLKTEQWTLFRGNSSRNAVSAPAAPIWDANWKISTFQEKRLVGSERSRFETAEKKMQTEEKNRHEKDGLLGIGASHPLVSENYVIYRSLRKIRAIDLHSGKPLWETVTSSPAVEQIIRLNKTKPTKSRNSYYSRQMQPMDEALLSQRTWRDMTLGTLSSDGKYLFSVDDVGVVNAYPNYPGMPENPYSLKKYNKLRGFELKTGKFKWEIGGPRGNAELEAAGTFFLGAPLPFGNLLFCIVEQDGEIQLMAIEPQPAEYDAKVVWSQSLITPTQSIKDDAIRRMSGLSPSYSNGVMVCPTSAGAVVAVDLSQRLLLWGYRHATRMPQTPGRPRFNPFNQQSNSNFLDQQSRWLDSVPTIAEGKVLLTPRDSNYLHCLNLLDGTVQWKIDRNEGYYLAGVHEGKAIVVGKTSINAYRLDNGKQAWQESVPIPKPSGRGYQTAGLYHIPLTTGSIATVDLNTGSILVKSKSRNGTIPGNLVASQGVIISQSATELSAYRPLSDIQNEINQKLASKAEDSQALALRGELKLHSGDVDDGLNDLRKAISIQPNPHAQTVLAEVILDGLRSDFNKYQAESIKLEKLIVDPEQKSRYLRTYADGLWRSGDQLGAAKKYIEFAGPSTGKLRLQQIDGSTSVRSDRWLRSRVKRIFAKATPEEQKGLNLLIKEQYDACQKAKSLDPLRKFIQCFNGMPIATEAQQQLAIRLSNQKNALLLEPDLLLHSLRNSKSKQISGFGTAKLATLRMNDLETRQLPQLLNELEGKYADVVCLEGKTGKELASSWKSRQEIKALLADRQIYPTTYQASSKTKSTRYVNTSTVRIENDSDGLFEGKSLVVDNTGMSLEARGELGQKLWKITLRKNRSSYSNYTQLYSARLLGNLLVFYAGAKFSVIDLTTTSESKRLLWQGDLIEQTGGQQ